MKKLLSIVVLMVIGISMSISNAQAIDVGTLVGNDLRFQFQDWNAGTLWTSSGTNLASGDTQADSFSLLTVTNINRISDGFPLWGATLGDALTGIQYGVNDNNVTVSAPSVQIDSVGGYIDLYNKAYTLNPTAANAPTAPLPDLNAPTDLWGATGTPSQLFLRLQFVPGVNGPGDTTTTFHVDQNNLTVPISGSSSGYLKVVGGSAASIFDSDAYNSIFPGADFYFIDQFSTGALTAAQREKGWLAGSGGDAFGTAVPEPATMLLFGTGILGLVGLKRKNMFV